jgi:hypothetical protein
MPPKYKLDICKNYVRDDRFCHPNQVTNHRYQPPSEEFLKHAHRKRGKR